MIKEELEVMFSRNFIKQYFKRNRNLIIFAVVLFIISIVIGYVYNYIFYDLIMEALKNMDVPFDNQIDATLALFSNNIRVNMLIILLGLTFSIISVIIVFINGVLIGFVGSILPVGQILAYTVPHGIFELPALIIAVTGSFLVTKFEINIMKGILQNGKTFKGELYKSRIIIEDIILSIVMITVLLVIAAVIEANLTIPIGNFILSF